MAVTGAMKISLGLTPLVAAATIRALIGAWHCRAISALATTSAAAPSLICEALPAVTVPSPPNDGFSRASTSSEVSARGPSSRSMRTSPLRKLMTTGTISSVNLPAATAAVALAMTFDGELILVVPADAALGGDVVGLGPHGDILERAPQSVVLHRVEHLLAAELPSLAGTGQQKRRPGHVLHAAGDDALGIAGANGLRRQGHGLQSRAANFVDRQRCHGRRQTRAQRRLPAREPVPSRPATRSP